MELRNYKDGVIITGNSFKHKDEIKGMGCVWNEGLVVNEEKTKGWYCKLGDNDAGKLKKIRAFIKKHDGQIIQSYDYELYQIRSFTPIFIYQYFAKYIDASLLFKNKSETKGVSKTKAFLADRLTMLVHMANEIPIDPVLADLITSQEFKSNAVITDKSMGEQLDYYEVPLIPSLDRLTSELLLTSLELDDGPENITNKRKALLLNLEPKLKDYLKE